LLAVFDLVAAVVVALMVRERFAAKATESVQVKVVPSA
jgi:hypothetical protein